jgi:hypothetical protein
MAPTVKFEKPALPTLWLDTFVGIKQAQMKRGEALQQIEVERGTPLKDLVLKLVGDGKLLCPKSDQEEEYVAERLEREVHGEFAELSLGISLRHRQSVLDNQIFSGMQAFIKKLDLIEVPSSSYFYGDPIASLEQRRHDKFVISIGPFKTAEMVARKVEAKAELGHTWEEIRKQNVLEKQTFEKQLVLEQLGYWGSCVELARRYEANLKAGRYDFNDLMAAFGSLLYLKVWKDKGGQPEGWAGLERYFHSSYLTELPIPYVACRLGADLMTGNEPIAPSDAMDVNLLAVALPVAHYVLTDRRMELRIKDRGLDKRCGTAVFSMNTIDGLFAELEKLK